MLDSKNGCLRQNPNKNMQRMHLEHAIDAQNKASQKFRPPHFCSVETYRQIAMECWSATIQRGHIDC